MLDGFDWIRRCATGSELAATLAVEQEGERPEEALVLAPPVSALAPACLRCRVFAPAPDSQYCPYCRVVVRRAKSMQQYSRKALVAYAFVNRPASALAGEAPSPAYAFQRDASRVLVAAPRRGLLEWLQRLLLRYGDELKGFLQICRTTGANESPSMGEVISFMSQRETLFAMDRLRVQFFASPYLLFHRSELDRRDALTFEASEFLGLLKMALSLRRLLRPEEQDALRRMLLARRPEQERFSWGRFMGQLDPAARSMLDAWRLRAWSKERLKLFFNLRDYVDYYRED